MSVKGIPALVEILKNYRNKLTDEEKSWVKLAKIDCEKVSRTIQTGEGQSYSASYYEHAKRIHNDAYKKEVQMATMLASFGLTVHLIQETTYGGSKIDALVNDVPVDFKMVGSGNSAIKQNYQKGMDKQHCRGIIMYMQTESTYRIKWRGTTREVFLEKAVESYTKQHKNGLLAIWIDDKQEFKVFDMQKTRAAHNNAARGNASAFAPAPD